MTTDLFVFHDVQAQDWYGAVTDLERALTKRDRERALEAYRRLFGALTRGCHGNLPLALADILLYGDSSLGTASRPDVDVPPGLLDGALWDLGALQGLARHHWTGETAGLLDLELPPLRELTPPPENRAVQNLADGLLQSEPKVLLETLLTCYRRHGTGELARFKAFRWSARERALLGIAHPASANAGTLIDIERQLVMLRRNTEAFLAGKPAQHTLLYGPRGSGKSTAIRSLLSDYADAGLRMVELAPGALADLMTVLERLRFRPHRYILFVDDLSFEADSSDYGPLKTLLEGSLTQRPDNVLVYATSNRRHLVKERFSDRPDPLSDDVHGWDTQHELLALSDRFGLTITFPDATQARYLEIVRSLAEREGLELEGLEQRAVRFADWGNGYSGRTARQFVDSLRAGTS